MSEKNTSPAKTAPTAQKQQLDVSNAARGVWLVKVPNYLSEIWTKAGPSTELGTMKDTSTKGRIKVAFHLSQELARQAQLDIGVEVPIEHKVLMQDTSSQSLCTFSEEVGGAGGVASGSIATAEGKVNQRADIQPTSSDVYMKLKRHQFRAAEKTKNTAQKLERAHVSSYKPRSQQKEEADNDKKKKINKRAKDDREVVLDLIFTAFQKHEYYNFKDLVQKTRQPVVYLREILREVCHYNTKAPHKNMWHLKPEYRHYQSKTESD